MKHLAAAMIVVVDVVELPLALPFAILPLIEASLAGRRIEKLVSHLRWGE